MRTICFYCLCLLCSILYAQEEGNFIVSDLRTGMADGDKAALLMVHFGTTYDSTRALTIEAMNEKARNSFPDFDMAEAYTSRIVIRRLRQRNIEKHTPKEALTDLAAKGYTHVLIQSTNIIDGIEMESLRKDVSAVAHLFKEVRIGTPLLYSVDDCQKVVEIMAERCPKESALVLVGHGTYTPSTATYAMIDYMAKAKGYTDMSVGTIEGYPTLDNVIAQLKAGKKKSVTLMPFMLVAGDHAHNDIAVDWKEALEKEGFRVNVIMEGLGQHPAIQELFIEHIRFMVAHKEIDIIAKKKAYAAAKD